MMIQIKKPPLPLPPPPQGCLTTAALPTRAARNLLVLTTPTRSTTIPTTISMARQSRHSVLPIIPTWTRKGKRAMAAPDSVSAVAAVDLDMEILEKKNNKNNKVFLRRTATPVSICFSTSHNDPAITGRSRGDGEGVIVARNSLNPDGGDESEPFVGGGNGRAVGSEPHVCVSLKKNVPVRVED
ncbi:hypothetical protein TB2_043665 [Malus domestica]